MIKKNYEMEILVNNKPVKEYFHNNKLYVEGRKDTTFAIKVKNNSASKVLFIPTIDGLSVIDGKNASFNSSGYIVNGYSALTIKGWRVSDEQIAEFYFSAVSDSYRKRQHGMGNNLGSIAVAVFREKEKNYQMCLQFPSTTIDQSTLNTGGLPNITSLPQMCGGLYSTGCSVANSVMSNNQTNSMLNAASVHEIGTGFGDRKESVVTTISFEKEDEPDSILEIFYNTRKQLCQIGIDFTTQQVVMSKSNSFPDEQRYCTPPTK